jgi:hypothetical protein
MIKKRKGDNHDKVKEKSMGQLVVVKEAGWWQTRDNMDKQIRG